MMNVLARRCLSLRSAARSRRWLVALLLTLPLSPRLLASPTDIIMLLDNSGSMRQNDPTFLLKGAVTKFFSTLPDDTRAGVVIFDQKVIFPVPLAKVDATMQEAVKRSLAGIDYRGQYTNIPAAMERAIYELKTGGRKDAAKIVVFMTDGIVDTGNPGVDAEKVKWLRDELAADATDNGIRIFGIAFTENADFFLIQSLAKKTSGEYFRALKPEDLDGVFATVKEKLVAAPAAAEAAPGAPVAPSTAPAAAPSAANSAAPATDCLGKLSAEDRQAIEEMAKAAAATPAALCAEMESAPAGQPLITPAPAPAAPPQEAHGSRLGVALVVGSALLLLIAAGVLALIVIKRRKPAAAAANPGSALVASVSPPRVPDAFVKDINGVTSEPATQITAKPMIVGRMAGTDPEHVDYFVVEQPTVGRRHALIKYRDFSFWISDQGSVNGTFLNGERIENERQLKHGDRIRFHKYEFEFSMPEMDQAGQTVFADPMNRTMVGDMDTMLGTASVAASSVAAAVVAQAAVVKDHHDEVFDLTGASGTAAQGDGESDDETAFTARDGAAEAAHETVVPVNLRSGILSGTQARAEAEFDAEASAFFDEDDLAVTASPHSATSVERGPLLQLDRDGAHEEIDTMQIPAAQFAPAAAVDDFSESETLLPVAPGTVADYQQTRDISLDEFMNTGSFDPPIPGAADLDDEDATLMPNMVPDRPLAIDDVFDVTAEGTIPPVRRDADDDDEDDHDRTTILN